MLYLIGNYFGNGMNASSPSLKKALEENAICTSRDYVIDKFPDGIMFLSHNDILDFALSRSTQEGLILEFGVYKGKTLNYIAESLEKTHDVRTISGFDSFEGLPEDWAGYFITKESFDLHKKIPKFHRSVNICSGFFDNSLPIWVTENLDEDTKLSLIHIDSDIYSCLLYTSPSPRDS